MMLDHSFLAESRRPVTPMLLRAAVAASGILPFVLTAKVGGFEVLPAIFAILLGSAAFLGWLWSPAQRSSSDMKEKPWLAISFGAAVAGSIAVFALHKDHQANAFWPLLTFVLLFTYEKFGRNSHILRHFLIPLLFGSGVMFVSAILGHPAQGAFPAAIAVLFISVLRFTLDIEQDVFENHGEQLGIEVHHHYRSRLATAAIIFFLFGTVSLWPWLGTIYGQGYFWVLLCGVLLPLVFFWGRIRQPKTEGARTALVRFNRIAPVVGFIHILAILVA